MLQSTTIAAMLVMVTLTNVQSNETHHEHYPAEVWCPQHTRSILSDTHEYLQCEPYDYIFFNDNHTEVIDYHPVNYVHGHVNPMDYFLSPSCNRWVRLRKDHHFQFDFPNGTIYEMKTGTTHQLGTFVYNPDLKEAIICRDHLLPGDDTEEITLWCSSHTIHTDGPPKIHTNGSLHVPQLDVTLRKGFYHVHNGRCNKTGCPVAVCLNLSMELLTCKALITPELERTPFEVLSNLSLLVKWDINHVLYPVGHYYLTSDHESANVCLEEIQHSSHFPDQNYPLHIVSAIFCFFTVLAQLLYPKLNYHVKALVCHIISMLVMYICLAASSLYLNVESVAGRFSWFGFYYVSAMSTHLWLSVVAYDVLANRHGPSEVSVSEMDRKRCMYAWGIPMVLCVLVIVLCHETNAARHLGLTLVSSESIFFDSYTSIFTFFYGPIALILLVNLAFVALTIWNMRRGRPARTSTENTEISKKRFYLFVKLFVVMGISFVADVISFVVKGVDDGRKPFYWTDVISGLQGVAIFVVYVCKRSTWWTLKRKFGYDASAETRSTVTTTSRLTSTDVEMQ